MKIIHHAAFAFVPILLAGSLRAAPPEYSVTVIDAPGFSGATSAAEINNKGQVVGNWVDAGRSFLHTPGTGATDLGQVVGSSHANVTSAVYGYNYTSHAFLYTPGAGMIDISPLALRHRREADAMVSLPRAGRPCFLAAQVSPKNSNLQPSGQRPGSAF